MIDHICDDISINPQNEPQEFLDQLFSRHMFFNHKNKQMWASDRIKNKRLRHIAEGGLERAKQNALYVGYSKQRIRNPNKITAKRAHDEIYLVYRTFNKIQDLGFNGFECWSDSRSEASARYWLAKVHKEYGKVK